MSASGPSPNSDHDFDTLGDRAVDRWIGVDEIKLGEGSPSSPDRSRGQRNAAKHRCRSPWQRLTRWIASKLARPRSLYDDPGSTWQEHLINMFAYVVMAAILAAFAYVVYRAMQLAGWL